MKKLTVSIPDELDTKMRTYVDDKYDGIKGGLSIVVKQALEEFFQKRYTQ